TGGGYILYFAGLSKVSPGAGSTLLFLKPPIASALAVLLLGERVTLPLLLSIVVISLSVFLVISSPSKKIEG
ncbi:MAG: EamA/RhaT family transporter, partial [Thermoplasmata archaeon]